MKLKLRRALGILNNEILLYGTSSDITELSRFIDKNLDE